MAAADAPISPARLRFLELKNNLANQGVNFTRDQLNGDKLQVTFFHEEGVISDAEYQQYSEDSSYLLADYDGLLSVEDDPMAELNPGGRRKTPQQYREFKQRMADIFPLVNYDITALSASIADYDAFSRMISLPSERNAKALYDLIQAEITARGSVGVESQSQSQNVPGGAQSQQTQSSQGQDPVIELKIDSYPILLERMKEALNSLNPVQRSLPVLRDIVLRASLPYKTALALNPDDTALYNQVVNKMNQLESDLDESKKLVANLREETTNSDGITKSIRALNGGIEAIGNRLDSNSIAFETTINNLLFQQRQIDAGIDPLMRITQADFKRRKDRVDNLMAASEPASPDQARNAYDTLIPYRAVLDDPALLDELGVMVAKFGAESLQARSRREATFTQAQVEELFGEGAEGLLSFSPAGSQGSSSSGKDEKINVLASLGGSETKEEEEGPLDAQQRDVQFAIDEAVRLGDLQKDDKELNTLQREWERKAEDLDNALIAAGQTVNSNNSYRISLDKAVANSRSRIHAKYPPPIVDLFAPPPAGVQRSSLVESPVAAERSASPPPETPAQRVARRRARNIRAFASGEAKVPTATAAEREEEKPAAATSQNPDVKDWASFGDLFTRIQSDLKVTEGGLSRNQTTRFRIVANIAARLVIAASTSVPRQTYNRKHLKYVAKVSVRELTYDRDEPGDTVWDEGTFETMQTTLKRRGLLFADHPDAQKSTFREAHWHFIVALNIAISQILYYNEVADEESWAVTKTEFSYNQLLLPLLEMTGLTDVMNDALDVPVPILNDEVTLSEDLSDMRVRVSPRFSGIVQKKTTDVAGEIKKLQTRINSREREQRKRKEKRNDLERSVPPIDDKGLAELKKQIDRITTSIATAQEGIDELKVEQQELKQRNPSETLARKRDNKSEKIEDLGPHVMVLLALLQDGLTSALITSGKEDDHYNARAHERLILMFANVVFWGMYESLAEYTSPLDANQEPWMFGAWVALDRYRNWSAQSNGTTTYIFKHFEDLDLSLKNGAPLWQEIQEKNKTTTYLPMSDSMALDLLLDIHFHTYLLKLVTPLPADIDSPWDFKTTRSYIRDDQRLIWKLFNKTPADAEEKKTKAKKPKEAKVKGTPGSSSAQRLKSDEKQPVVLIAKRRQDMQAEAAALNAVPLSTKEVKEELKKRKAELLDKPEKMNEATPDGNDEESHKAKLTQYFLAYDRLWFAVKPRTQIGGDADCPGFEYLPYSLPDRRWIYDPQASFDNRTKKAANHIRDYIICRATHAYLQDQWLLYILKRLKPIPTKQQSEEAARRRAVQSSGLGRASAPLPPQPTEIKTIDLTRSPIQEEEEESLGEEELTVVEDYIRPARGRITNTSRLVSTTPAQSQFAQPLSQSTIDTQPVSNPSEPASTSTMSSESSRLAQESSAAALASKLAEARARAEAAKRSRAAFAARQAFLLANATR